MLTGFPLNQLGTIKIYQYKVQDLQLKASPGKLDHLESELNKKLPSISKKKITGKPKEKFLMQKGGFVPLSFVFSSHGKRIYVENEAFGVCNSRIDTNGNVTVYLQRRSYEVI